MTFRVFLLSAISLTLSFQKTFAISDSGQLRLRAIVYPSVTISPILTGPADDIVQNSKVRSNMEEGTYKIYESAKRGKSLGHNRYRQIVIEAK